MFFPNEEALRAARAEKKILVVDDERHIVRLIQVNLERQGYRTDFAYTGQEAIEKFEEYGPDLVVCDWMMPYASGMDVLDEIRKRAPKLPFIFLTAKAQYRDVALGYDKRATFYITKPFNPMQVLDVVDVCFFHPLAVDLHERNAWTLGTLAIELSNENEGLRTEIAELKAGLSGESLATQSLADSSEMEAIRATAGHTAHKLGGAFAKVGMAARMIGEQAGSDPQTTKLTEIIEQGVEESREKLRELMEFLAHPRIGREVVRAADLVLQVADEMRAQLPERIKIPPVQILPEAEQVYVSVDTPVFAGVLKELVSNAAKAMEGQSEGGTIQLLLRYLVGVNCVDVHVSDNGPGLPEGVLNNRFRAPVESESGFGYGLYFVNRVVRMMDGLLNAYPSPRGTTFSIELPAERAPGPPSLPEPA